MFCLNTHYLLLLYRLLRHRPDLQQCHSLVAVTRFPRNRKPITVSAAQNSTQCVRVCFSRFLLVRGVRYIFTLCVSIFRCGAFILDWFSCVYIYMGFVLSGAGRWSACVTRLSKHSLWQPPDSSCHCQHRCRRRPPSHHRHPCAYCLQA